MAERRRVVPDCSVLVEAFLRPSKGSRYVRATQLVSEIRNERVVCFAPEILIFEFMKVTRDLIGGRRPQLASREEVDQQWNDFLKLSESIVYIPTMKLAAAAMTCCRDSDISAQDSWYLAAAEAYSAELWISHWHRDGFTVSASKAYGNVYTLDQNDFYFPTRKRKG